MIDKGQRVVCINKNNMHFGKKGTFTEWLAIALKVKFDNGEEDLFLLKDLKKIND